MSNDNPHVDINRHLDNLPENLREIYTTPTYGLTTTQTLMLHMIKWLLGGPQAAGRTELMAHAFIQLAIEQRNKKIYLFDHGMACGTSLHHSRDIMKDAVHRVWKQHYKEFDLQFFQIDFHIICR